MYVDKPEWVSHNGTAIYAVDVDAEGTRLATCGSDSSVRVWNLLPILDERHELDPSVPKLLATIADHNGAVNVVRFSRSGRRLASGSDDKVALVHELKAGRGTANFGSSEANVENWRPVHSFRGHANNVADLAWSRDDRWLATASLDSTVVVWEVEDNRRVVTLAGHVGFAKGVAWDPMGTYLASQGDDGVRIWRCQDWSQVAHVSDPFKSASAQNFFLRLAWTPDGQYLAAANAYVRGVGCNVSPLLKREAWANVDHQFVGHSASVISVRFNPHMFYVPQQPQATDTAAAPAAGQEPAAPGAGTPAAAGANGSAAAGTAAAANGRPTAEQQPAAQQPDTSDTASIVVALASQDKRFSVWEASRTRPLLVGAGFFKLGVLDVAWTPDGYNLLACSYDGTISLCRFTAAELGKPLPAPQFQELLTELYGDPALRSKALVQSAEQLQLQAAAAAAAAAASKAAGKAAAPPPEQQLAAARPNVNALDALASRIMPAGAAAATSMPARAAAPAAAAERRVVPAAVAAAGDGAGPSGRGMEPPPPKRLNTGAGTPAPGISRPLDSPGGGVAAGGGGGAAGRAMAEPALQELVSVRLGEVEEPLQPGRRQPVVLEASNTGRDYRGQPLAQLVCTCSSKRIWTDSVHGQVQALAGSLCYAAVALRSGELLTYSPMGRRTLPAMHLGGLPVRLVASGDWRLMVLTLEGQLKVYNMQQFKLEVAASVAPLLAPGVRVVHMKLASHTLQPLVTLSNRSAYLYHAPVQEWLKVADDSFAASPHYTSLPLLSQGGELAQACSRVAELPGGRSHADVFAAARSGHAQEADARAHLEASIASSMVLKEPGEYKRWLLMYVRHLVVYCDEGRLRELVQDLLGPLRWRPGSGHPWVPHILGLDKRALLQQEVLQEMSRGEAPALRQLVTDVMEALRDVAAFSGQGQQLSRVHAEAVQQAGQVAAAVAGLSQQQQQQQQRQQQQDRSAGGAGASGTAGGGVQQMGQLHVPVSSATPEAMANGGTANAGGMHTLQGTQQPQPQQRQAKHIMPMATVLSEGRTPLQPQPLPQQLGSSAADVPGSTKATNT